MKRTLTHQEKKQAEALALSVRRSIFVWEASRLLEQQRGKAAATLPRPWTALDLDLRMQFVGAVERACCAEDPDPDTSQLFRALCDTAREFIRD
jgi:hypothetical protein